MRDQLVGFLEGAFVEQELDALACLHLAIFMLTGAALLAAALLGEGIALFQLGQFLLQVHGLEL